MLRTFPVVLLETMFHYTDEPRFTIEQIDLLQRLRRTGMTRHEILHALETFDRLDQEHSDKFGRRSAYGSGGGSCSNSTTNNVPASSSTATASTQTQHSGMSPSPSNSYDTSPQPCTTHQNGRESNERLSAFNGKMSPTRYPLANSMAQRSYSFEASEEDLDVDDKVEELMRSHGHSKILSERLKRFYLSAPGISQSRISHWLLQQGSDLSEQKKRAFYRWYQLEKTNPGATLSMRLAPIPVEEPEWRQTPPPVTATSGTFRLRRGSRFTWRKECLAVMERLAPIPVEEPEWRQTPPPVTATSGTFRLRRGSRFTWRKECLAVMESWKGSWWGNLGVVAGPQPQGSVVCVPHPPVARYLLRHFALWSRNSRKKLSDLERVTSLKVYNWFANRRKEIKRRANIEAAILESHGIDVQSPGGHSNSDDVDGNDYSEQDAWQVRNGEEEGRCTEGGREAEKLEDSRSCSKQDDSTSHSDHQDPISLAVEMAAVNHTILALARQGTSEIKTEALDDD
nr:homeobox-containing protein 1 [Pogona vitticeps]